MSLRTVHKLFSAAGTATRAWLYQPRLERARKYLLTRDLYVADISDRAGFRDVSHFGGCSAIPSAEPGPVPKEERAQRLVMFCAGSIFKERCPRC